MSGTGEFSEMNNKLLSLLGIARRAGRLTMGFDAAAESIKKGESKLLLLSDDLSEKSKKSIGYTAQQNGVEVLITGCTMSDTGNALGRKQTGIISVNDSGFAKKMKDLCTVNSQEECI